MGPTTTTKKPTTTTKKPTTTTKKLTSATSCSEVVKIATKLTTLAISFPTSPEVPELSLQITSSSATSCTDAEKNDLKNLDSKFQSALTEITKALTEAQKELELGTVGNKYHQERN